MACLSLHPLLRSSRAARAAAYPKALNEFDALADEFGKGGFPLPAVMTLYKNDSFVAYLLARGVIVGPQLLFPERPDDIQPWTLVEGTLYGEHHWITRTEEYWYDPWACLDTKRRPHRTHAMPDAFIPYRGGCVRLHEVDGPPPDDAVGSTPGTCAACHGANFLRNRKGQWRCIDCGERVRPED